MGYGDLHAFNVAEAIFCTLSIFTNIVINAWITGKAALPICAECYQVSATYMHAFIVHPAYWPAFCGRDHRGHTSVTETSEETS